MIIVKAPTRISFGGGGTDLATYYEKYGGLVVSTSIDKYFYSFFKPRNDKKIQIISSDLGIIKTFENFDHLDFGELAIPVAVIKHFDFKKGFELFLSSEVPVGSGLGGSSSLCVNLVKLFSDLQNLNLSKKKIAEEAYKVRVNDLKLPVGKQDEYAAAFGGMNFIQFEKDDVKVETLKIRNDIKEHLQKNLTVFYTGKSKDSTPILKSMEKASGQSIDALHTAKKLGLEIKKSLESGDLQKFGELLHESWLAKKNFAKGVSNESLDKVYELARKNGALGGKLMGAGGAGFFLFYCESQNQENLRKALEKENLQKFEINFENDGVTKLK